MSISSRKQRTALQLAAILHVAAILLAAQAGFGATAPALKMDELFKNVTTTAPVCFGKEYSKVHMASRPKQTVEQIRVKLTKYSADPQTSSAGLRIEARLKGESGLNYVADMSCMDSKSKVVCVIECDGGSVTITKASATNLTLKNNGITVKGGCGDEGADGEPGGVTKFLAALKGGDDIFDLEALPKSFCSDSDTVVFTD